MDFDPKQEEAIKACCDTKRRVVAVTGQAGTGKTTIMRAVYNLLTEAGYSVVLCAPTGKAAKRIKEATGIEAKTIHRLLEYTQPGHPDPETGKIIQTSYPRRDKQFPLEPDVILADEYAMVNQEVHRALFDAVRPGGRVCVFGDVNQLPPIESSPGLRKRMSMFQELLVKFDGITLESIHRQGEGSGIVENGHRILRGFIPVRKPDFELRITNRAIDDLRNFVLESLENGVNFAALDNQIISPTNKTWVGTISLNAALQLLLQPEVDKWIDVPRHSWDKTPLRFCIGDKVINTKNNYSLSIFNGETGIVTDFNELGEIFIDFGDRRVTVPPMIEVVSSTGKVFLFDPRKDLYLAYCVTTHKAQGSEYRNVVYVLNKSSKFIQTRNNFYTGITRASSKATVITDQESLSFSVWRKTSAMEG